MSYQLRIVQRGNPLFFHEFRWTKGRRTDNETDVSTSHNQAKEYPRLSGSNENKERQKSPGQQAREGAVEADSQRRAMKKRIGIGKKG